MGVSQQVVGANGTPSGLSRAGGDGARDRARTCVCVCVLVCVRVCNVSLQTVKLNQGSREELLTVELKNGQNSSLLSLRSGRHEITKELQSKSGLCQ